MMRQRVTFHGILRGKGGEVPCTVKATRIGFLIIEVDPQSIEVFSPNPIPLPDGHYALFLEGKCYHGHLEKGTFVV